jgi:NAD/NADP transhydrogenase beta subunit
MKFEGEATTTTVDQTSRLLMESESVIIVPGYGLAVAKGRYPRENMVDILRKAGKRVPFGRAHGDSRLLDSGCCLERCGKAQGCWGLMCTVDVS